jgi:AcrR family transcriptional regulator
MAAIAVASDTAIGSLYQFFPSKDAVVDALAEQFIAAWRRHKETYANEPLDDIERRVDRALDARLAFHLEYAALRTFLEADPARAASVRTVQDEVDGVIPDLVRRYPHRTPAALRRTLRVLAAMIRGVMPMIVAEDDLRERARLLAETKAAVKACLHERVV